jgi:hypothetical protein
MVQNIGKTGVSALLRFQDILETTKLLGTPGGLATIVPTFDLMPFIGAFGFNSTSDYDPGGSGYETLYTVPSHELWHPIGINISQASGTCTFSSLLMDQGSNRLIINRQTAATTLDFLFPDNFWLPAGSVIRVNIAAYSSGTLDTELYSQKFRSLTTASISE